MRGVVSQHPPEVRGAHRYLAGLRLGQEERTEAQHEGTEPEGGVQPS